MWLMQNGMGDREQAGSAATPYLRLFALTAIAYFWSRMVATAEQALAGRVDRDRFLWR